MDESEFKEALLSVMERKRHWAWPAFTGGLVPKERLHFHLEQEYATYVRDFPVLVARAYVRCPIPFVRRALIENVYEEETGGLCAGRPHPELFLEYPRGLGMDVSRFERVELSPAAAGFRSHLDEVTLGESWGPGAAVTTLFLEGTEYERGELDPSAPRRPEPPLTAHPLVRHYGLPLEHLQLTKAHRTVEGHHRALSWQVILGYVESERRPDVVAAVETALELWQGYRDEVARLCGIVRDASGAPQLARESSW